MKVVLAQINPIVGDLKGNSQKIISSIEKGKKAGADIVLFPELALTGYPPDDLLLLPQFITSVENHLKEIQESTKGIAAIVGTPRPNTTGKGKPLFNSAAVFSDQKLIGYQDKTLLPTYDVFYEGRYFEPSTEVKTWSIAGKNVGITICEDIWQHSALLQEVIYYRDPIIDLQKFKPEIVLNLSASPYSVTKFQRRMNVCSKAVHTLHCPLLLCNQVGGNDGLIFDGFSMYVDQSGNLLKHAKGFEEDWLFVDLNETLAPIQFEEHPTESLYQALVLGLKDYFHKSGFRKACLGLSGGIDSAIVACIASDALGNQNILGVSMPSRFSTKESLTEAHQLAKTLGIQYRVIPIEEPFESYLKILQPNFEGKPEDITEENLQARIRGMILMALSNKLGYIVLSTGNKSELAMGYATLYGDMCGGLGVINDVTKKQVYELANWINRDEEIIPWNTIKKPPSAELKPNQRDSDSLPEYEIIDNVLKEYVEEHRTPEGIAKKYEYPLSLVNDLVKKIHQNEYKRRQSPPGLRVSEKSFTAGRRFPIVQKWV